MLFVAEYTGRSIRPLVLEATPSHFNPVPNSTNFQVGVLFDRAMDTGMAPVVTLTNLTSGWATNLTVTGTWSATVESDDTYHTPLFSFTNGMDGLYDVWVASARATDAEILETTNVLSLTVNSTLPTNPVVSLAATNESSVTLAWTHYTAPDDLTGFRGG